MKKGLFSLVASGFIAGSTLLAADLTIYHGWNLVSTAGVESVPSSCILNQVPNGAILFRYDNEQKKWEAISNDNTINQKIDAAPFIDLVSSPLALTQGFWLLNPSSMTKTIQLPCENMPVFTFGNSVEVDFNAFLQPGKVLFMPRVPEGEYEKLIVQTNNILEDKEYEYDNGSFRLNDDRNMTYSITSPISLHITMPSGEEGVLDVKEAKEILKIKGEDVTNLGLTYLAMQYTVIKAGAIDWDEEEWIQEQGIASIEELKNRFTNPNEHYWFDEGDNRIVMFAAAEPSATSGDIVEARFDGYWEGCDDPDPDHCKKYVRTTNVVGHWQLRDDAVLEADITAYHYKKFWKEENGRFYEGEQDDVGIVYNFFGVIAEDPQAYEDLLRRNIAARYQH